MRHFQRYILLGLFFISLSSRAGTTPEILSNLQKAYESIQSIEARFQQKYRSKRFGDKVSQGRVWLQKPGKMRWEYDEPKGKLLLSDGKSVILYDPEDRQAIESPIPKNEGLPVPLSFLWGKEKIEDVFEVEVQPKWVLHCKPKHPISNVSELFLTLRDDRFPVITNSRVIDSLGGESDISFTEIQTNSKIPGEKFTFVPPQGVQIVKMEMKSEGVKK